MLQVLWGGGVMSSINAVGGLPMAAHRGLLAHTLKTDLLFQG